MKQLTFGKLFTLLNPVGVVKDKTFTIPHVWKGISGHIRKLVLLCYGRISLVPAKSQQVFSLISFLVRLHNNHGAALSVKWLKACHVCLQRFVGDDRISSLRAIDPTLPLPRLINGLPFIIPLVDRGRIRAGDPKVTQWWLSLFSIYRVLECDPSPKLASITDPYTGDEAVLSRLQLEIYNSPFVRFFSYLKGYEGWLAKANLYPSSVSMFRTASPSNNVSWHGIGTDILLLRRTGMSHFYNDYLTLVGSRYLNTLAYDVMNILDTTYNRLVTLNLDHKGIKPDVWLPARKYSASGLVGQLSYKFEAAGKLRVFAMVDWWTQNALAPLHRELFRLLRLIPNDGTFDQDASVKRCIEKSRVSAGAYSFDLSSATDRLPVRLQSALLDQILQGRYCIGEAWRQLLTAREYYAPELEGLIEPGPVKYAVGQPMGALSSWAMLAVTHHFLVQYCALQNNRGRTWFENYEVLGDDLVIFDKEIAESYLELMKQLGVEINLSKSIVSPTRSSFEFAKRTVMDSVNVSAISLKQLISETSMAARLNNIFYWANAGLLRNVTVLRALLCRYGKWNSDKEFCFPLISLLGALFKRKEVTLNDILRPMVDPEALDAELLNSTVALPVRTLLTELRAKLVGEGRDLIFSSDDDRREIASEHEELLSDMVVLKALSVAKEIERKFDSWKAMVRSSLVSGWPSALKPELGGPLFIEEWLFETVDNFEGFDPTEFVDHIEAIAIKQAKIHNLDLDKALELLSSVEDKKRRWMFGCPVKREDEVMKEGTSPLFRFILDNLGRSSLSYLKERPYWD